MLIPGNPVKLSRAPERRVPWVGGHTDAVLTELLGLTAANIAALQADGVITP